MFVGDRLQFQIRVERARLADAFEQFEVVVAVRIEKAVVEIEAIFGGELLGGEHLAFTEAQWADDLAGEHPVLDLICRTFYVGDAKIARGRFDLVDRRRRDDRDAVALSLMRLDDTTGIGLIISSIMFFLEFLSTYNVTPFPYHLNQ